MTRDQVTAELLSVGYRDYILELPTGMGKSKQAIELMRKYLRNREDLKVLILVPRVVLVNNWKDELAKWYKDCKINIQIACYKSIEKYAGNWDMVIFDEAHHLTDRCMEALESFTIYHNIFLSATLTRDMKQAIQNRCPGIYTYRVSMKKAIESEVLPEPTVYLMPLFLNTTRMTETIIKNPRGKTTKEVTYDGRWEATRNKHIKYIIHCTQSQKHEHLCSMVEWYKKQYMTTRNEGLKHLWLRASLDRLQWLSNIKVKYSIDINNMCINKKIRSLVFCSSIDQSNLFPKTHPINSKNSVKDNQVYLDNFNKGVINNVTAVNSLNEGVNLVNCQVGVFNTINSSEIMTIQKIGRILRHPNPILIIPYFSSTREEELVDKMLEHYNKDNVKKIMNISQIKL